MNHRSACVDSDNDEDLYYDYEPTVECILNINDDPEEPKVPLEEPPAAVPSSMLNLNHRSVNDDYDFEPTVEAILNDLEKPPPPPASSVPNDCSYSYYSTTTWKKPPLSPNDDTDDDHYPDTVLVETFDSIEAMDEETLPTTTTPNNKNSTPRTSIRRKQKLFWFVFLGSMIVVSCAVYVLFLGLQHRAEDTTTTSSSSSSSSSGGAAALDDEDDIAWIDIGNNNNNNNKDDETDPPSSLDNIFSTKQPLEEELTSPTTTTTTTTTPLAPSPSPTKSKSPTTTTTTPKTATPTQNPTTAALFCQSTIQADFQCYLPQTTIQMIFRNCDPLEDDWIGIYPDDPQADLQNLGDPLQ